MSERESDMDRQHELDAVRWSPQLDHSREVVLSVVDVLRDTITSPIERIPRLTSDDFLDNVVRGKVHDRQMDDEVEEHHLAGIEQARRVLELVSKGELCESVHGGEPLSVLVDHEVVLETTEVGKSEGDEDPISLPIDLIERPLLGHHLDHKIGSRCLAGGDAQLKCKWMRFGNVGQSASALRWCCSGGGLRGRFRRSLHGLRVLHRDLLRRGLASLEHSLAEGVRRHP
mmetsp:Transcript_16935/g.46867  ORF Transcript_16935/g.46867 Transcript_16935/m.46867 type:complete len:229 (+) Transcript_16935:668-1354(+)